MLPELTGNLTIDAVLYGLFALLAMTALFSGGDFDG